MFSHSRMSAGREFQVDGAATEKARRASSVRMRGTTLVTISRVWTSTSLKRRTQETYVQTPLTRFCCGFVILICFVSHCNNCKRSTTNPQQIEGYTTYRNICQTNAGRRGQRSTYCQARHRADNWLQCDLLALNKSTTSPQVQNIQQVLQQAVQHLQQNRIGLNGDRTLGL